MAATQILTVSDDPIALEDTLDLSGIDASATLFVQNVDPRSRCWITESEPKPVPGASTPAHFITPAGTWYVERDPAAIIKFWVWTNAGQRSTLAVSVAV